MLTIEQRLVRLERTNRRYRFGIAALAIGLFGALAIGAAQEVKVAEVVRARKFELLDSNGRIRAELSITPGMFGEQRDGTTKTETGTTLQLVGENGEYGLVLAVGAGAAAIELHANGTGGNVEIVATPGQSSFMLQHRGSHNRINLDVPSERQPRIAIEVDGKRAWTTP